MSRGRCNQAANGMTLIEFLVVLSILSLLIGVLLPALGAARRTAQCAQQSTQVRGIHQGLVLYSQGNNHWYPGIDSTGHSIDISVSGRFKTLLDGLFFTAPYIVSHAETNTHIKPWESGPFTELNYSYAMLSISLPGARRDEWRDTANPLAIMFSDRNTGADTQTQAQSIWTSIPGDWRGAVVFNDNSTSFLTTHLVPETRYDHITTKDDNLFDSPAGDDALLMYVETAPLIANPSTQPAVSP